MMKNIFLSLVLLFLYAISFGQVRTSPKINWVKRDTIPYSYSYPNSWKLNRAKLMGTDFILYAPVEGVGSSDFRPNINLLVQDLTANPLSIKEYQKLSLDQIPQFLTHSQIILNEIKKGAHGEYIHMIYAGKLGMNPLKFEQYIYLHSQKAYVLTLTSTPQHFDLDKVQGEEILKRFTLK